MSSIERQRRHHQLQFSQHFHILILKLTEQLSPNSHHINHFCQICINLNPHHKCKDQEKLKRQSVVCCFNFFLISQKALSPAHLTGKWGFQGGGRGEFPFCWCVGTEIVLINFISCNIFFRCQKY